MRAIVIALTLFAVAGGLAGCGKKGPLYLPQDAPVESRDGEREPEKKS